MSATPENRYVVRHKVDQLGGLYYIFDTQENKKVGTEWWSEGGAMNDCTQWNTTGQGWAYTSGRALVVSEEDKVVIAEPPEYPGATKDYNIKRGGYACA